ncbi:hypothetical protein BC831DRAFT_438158 [Entophlyctis helioformis]|nr:hypothetical protein BC831DRAFT_507095 [Entophlyctis helioformis]KAI8919569.1 hypothetical protein BC831DRAFT_438158 [Entophlyctis helioformis]
MAAVARACRFPNDTIAADTELLLLAASIPLPEDIPTSDDELLYLAASIPLPEDIPTANFGVALASAAVPILEMIPAIAFAAPRSDAINCEDNANYPPPPTVDSPEPITEKRKIAKPRASTTKKAQWQAQTTVPVSGFNFAVALAAVPILETIPAVAFATPKSRSNEEQRVIYEDEALRPPPPVIDSMVAVAARPTLKPKISKVKKAKPSVPTSDFTFVFAVNSKG